MTFKETLDRYNIPFKTLIEDVEAKTFKVVLATRFTVQRVKRACIKHNHKIINEKHSITGYELNGLTNHEEAA